MKKVFALLLLLLAMKVYSQESDSTKLPSRIVTKVMIPGGHGYATNHGYSAYDTIQVLVINKFGLNQDPTTGQFDDIYDTVRIQRCMPIVYTAERNLIEYKVVK